MDYLENLNPNQKLAVTTVEGPLLVVAGAGSGKTRVLTARIAHLIKAQQVPPYQIAAVTFTNKAAGEMRERVENLVGANGSQVFMGTFHSLCVRILRFEVAQSGYQPNFQIFDQADQLVVIRECLKELGMDPKRIPPKQVLGSIGKAKDELIAPAEYPTPGGDYWAQTVAKVYAKYQEKLQRSNALDFDDLIMATVRMFQKHPQVLRKYQDRFRYILVDEYQDTNMAQYMLVQLMAEQSGNICVVGDEDQSIYAFRGADIRNILEFEKDFPGAAVIKLEENYRSTKTILGAANSVIRNNTERKDKTLWTNREQGEKVVFHQGESERHEARFVADTIEGLRSREGCMFRDVTILYRTHALSRVFEEEFMRRGVPYRIVAGLRFYERKEIKDLLAYLRLIHNPQNDQSFLRVVNVPRRGLGDATLAKLGAYAEQFDLSLFGALSYLDGLDGLGSRFRKSLEAFRVLIEGLRTQLGDFTLTELTRSVLEQSGYLRELEAEGDAEAAARIENLEEFLSVTRQFEAEVSPTDLGAFLEHVALINEVDSYDAQADAVSMMTLHASKGLEFPVVFIVGMEDGIFPHTRSSLEGEQLEEERRLAYVGMTRAEDRLFLTCSRQRTLYGATQLNPVSTFVGEISQEFVEQVGSSRFPMNAGDLVPKPRPRPIVSNASYKPGDKVLHKAWGEGMVVSVSEAGGDLQLSIAFQDQGIKKVIAHLAPITKIS
ncbi:MAG: DNA helicase PcrA [Bacillota bacterium]|jgi:DNA helicase-2/ATP-dependent DNA helicase PcrA|nr:DNA helicase PcrA [Bacillota bacterium]HHT89510.1 DNA helicase PcrA [Bacillota bacterium]